jgi:hypothetical protein
LRLERSRLHNIEKENVAKEGANGRRVLLVHVDPSDERRLLYKKLKKVSYSWND